MSETQYGTVLNCGKGLEVSVLDGSTEIHWVKVSFSRGDLKVEGNRVIASVFSEGSEGDSSGWWVDLNEQQVRLIVSMLQQGMHTGRRAEDD